MMALAARPSLAIHAPIQRTTACGLVIFDDPQERGAGTAYLPDALPQRIRSMNDLRSDMIWVANVPDRGLSRTHPGLRASDYFGASISDIAYDLGLAYSRGYPLNAQEGVAIATIMSRAVVVASRVYGWDLDGGAAPLGGETLFEDIAMAMRMEPPHKASGDSIGSRLGHACQDRSAPNWPFEPLERLVPVTLRFNRLAYARQLLAQLVPAGADWVEVGQGQRIDRLPTLVNLAIDWSETAPDVVALAAFGQTGKRKQQLRLWACGPELDWLGPLCRAHVHAALINERGYSLLAAPLQMPVPLAVRSQLTMSYSAGLVGKAHLDAVLSAECYQGSKGRFASATGAWLRAYDRGFMFGVACRAHAAGFLVRRYGDGEIGLRVREDQLQALLKFKRDLGFMYPAIESLVPGVSPCEEGEGGWGTVTTSESYGVEGGS
ncbi:hypothetical protein [Cupriavidus necator]|uniref:hypothetical protein n=1 Tax=Cupriavidus necator TaxID=106590 RepID=UPI00339D74F4